MIHPLALIHSSAKIGANVKIGPYTVIGENVEIGDETIIESHVVINGPTKIGKGNHFYQFSSIGENPQDKKYHGEQTELVIGDRNTFREFMTISRGTAQDKGATRIGNDNLFMAYVHIAHDCVVGDFVVFSNNASLAGHVVVDSYCNLGGFVGVHQFCRIGSYSFSAGGSIIVKDVPPFVMVSGHPAEAFGLNLVGIKRQGRTAEDITYLKRAYKLIYRDGLTSEEAIDSLQALVPSCADVQLLIDFMKKSERGITR